MAARNAELYEYLCPNAKEKRSAQPGGPFLFCRDEMHENPHMLIQALPPLSQGTDSHVASPALVVSAEARPLFVSGLRDTSLISPRCIFGAPTAAQRSGCGGERRRNGTSKPPRMRGGAGCGVSADDRRRFGELLGMTEYDTFRFVIARPVRTLAAAIRIPRGVGDAAPYKG